MLKICTRRNVLRDGLRKFSSVACNSGLDFVEAVKYEGAAPLQSVGFSIFPNFLSQEEQEKLETSVSRILRVRESYRPTAIGRKVIEIIPPEPLPKAIQELLPRLKQFNARTPNYVAINEYTYGGGIEPHVDTYTKSDTIVTISLMEDVVMDLTNEDTKEHVKLLLQPRSLLLLEKDARYKWKHGIEASKSHWFKGKEIKRNRRVSLTFLFD